MTSALQVAPPRTRALRITRTARRDRSLRTIFSNKPEHGRYYNPDGKWFYEHDLQEETVQLIVAAVEGGLEPPTLETTIHFKREKADTESQDDVATDISSVEEQPG